MGRSKERMLIAIVVLSAAGYAIAEDITLTSYYPSPRGVYDALRSNAVFVRGGDGDVDNNGTVAIADINAANLCASGVNGSTSPGCAAADVNGDGVVNGVDVNAINQAVFLVPPLVNNVLRDAAKGVAGRLVAPALNGALHLGVNALGNPVGGVCVAPMYWVDIDGDRTIDNGECADTTGGGGIQIQPLGEIGIGTAAPTARLHVLQTANQSAFRVDDVAGDVTPLVVDPDGNVSIGRPAVQTAKLHVQGSGVGAGLARIRVTSTDNQAGIAFESDNSGETVVYSPTGTNDLRLHAGGGDRMSVLAAGGVDIISGNLTVQGVGDLTVQGGDVFVPAGNVGIGTATPSARLHVQSGASSFRVDGAGGANPFVVDGQKVAVNQDIQGGWYSNLQVRGAIEAYNTDDERFARGGSSLYLNNPDSPVSFWQMTHGDNGNLAWSNPETGTLGTYMWLERRGVTNFRFNVNGSKNFRIPHPLDPAGKELLHSTIEGPEIAVFYRGEARLAGGAATVRLPTYFEALTRKDGRTVLLTAKGGWSPLYVDGEVVDGSFVVRTTAEGNTEQAFYWEVKAVRADQEPLEVEVPREPAPTTAH